MANFNALGSFVMPIIFVFIITYGLFKKVDVFDAFLHGAAGGFKSAIGILPALCGLLAAVSMLRTSGALFAFIKIFSLFLHLLGIPPEILPLALLRPFSGSGSLAVAADIFKNFGANSYISKTAAVIMGSTETTFYAIAVYFGSVGIKNTRYTVKAALIADFCALITGVWICRLFFG